MSRSPLTGERERAQIVTMLRWLLYLVFVAIGYVFLRRLSEVLSPLLMAAGIAYLFDPVADALEARGVRRSLAVALILCVVLSALIGLGLLLFPLLWTELDRFATHLPAMVEAARTWLDRRFGLALPAEWTGILASKELGEMLSKALGPVASAAATALGGIFSLLAYLAELLLVPVFAFYFLLDWHRILARIEALVPPRHRLAVTSVAGEIDAVVSSWLRGQFTVVAILALLYAGCFYAIGIQLAISIGLLVGLLTIVPFLGTLVGASITALLVLLDWPGPERVLAVIAVFAVLHLLEAAVLTPKIVGKRVGLGEAGALFAVLAGGKLLGLVGVLLAVPLAASVAVLARKALAYYEHSAFFGQRDAAPPPT